MRPSSERAEDRKISHARQSQAGSAPLAGSGQATSSSDGAANRPYPKAQDKRTKDHAAARAHRRRWRRIAKLSEHCRMLDDSQPARRLDGVASLEALQRDASALAREVEAATRSYDRTAWIGYAAIFIVIPFVVVLFRLHMQTWHYYLAGVLFLAGALLTHALELAAMERRDKAIQAFEGMREAYEAARALQRDAHP